jgi:hypothetical protein
MEVRIRFMDVCETVFWESVCGKFIPGRKPMGGTIRRRRVIEEAVMIHGAGC